MKESYVKEGITISRCRSQEIGTTYVLVIVPLYKENGDQVKVAVHHTSPTSKLGDWNCMEVRTFGAMHDYLHVINAGIFLDPISREVDGITIIDGEILKATGVTLFPQEQYVLGITENGEFKTYFNDTTEHILADGCIHAVTGFVPLIEGGKLVEEEVLHICPHCDERHPRQIIGRLFNGDYFTFWCDGRTDGESGMTLRECVTTIVENLGTGVSFAFSLDGGGSAQSVVGKKLITRVIEERSVPNVITFE